MLYDQSNDYDDMGLIMYKAAKAVEEHGHTKFTNQGKNGVCLLGALNIAFTGDAVGVRKLGINGKTFKTFVKVTDELIKYVYPDFEKGNSWFYLVNWNNQPERTGQEVIDLFRRGAEAHKKTLVTV